MIPDKNNKVSICVRWITLLYKVPLDQNLNFKIFFSNNLLPTMQKRLLATGRSEWCSRQQLLKQEKLLQSKRFSKINATKTENFKY